MLKFGKIKPFLLRFGMFLLHSEPCQVVKIGEFGSKILYKI
nr:MAG TPA: hypothetical protein [Siphoviridae sp. ctHdl3]